MKEYKISLKRKIFTGLAAPCLLFISIYVLIELYPFDRFSLFENILLISIPLLIIPYSVYSLLFVFSAKLIISEDKLVAKSIFSMKEILTKNIKGFREDKKNIQIEAINDNNLIIEISYLFENFNEIEKWLTVNFTNLEIREYINDKKDILANNELGWKTNNREKEFSRLKSIVTILNWTAFIVFFWNLRLGLSDRPALIITFLFPIVCLALNKYYKGLIMISYNPKSLLPSLQKAIVLSCINLFFIVIYNYHLIDYTNIRIPIVILTILLVVILVYKNKEFKSEILYASYSVVSLTIVFALYISGILILLNCNLDDSKSDIQYVRVIKKEHKAKYNRNYIFLNKLRDDNTNFLEFNVETDLFEKVKIGDEVKLELKKGFLNFPWYQISK